MRLGRGIEADDGETEHRFGVACSTGHLCRRWHRRRALALASCSPVDARRGPRRDLRRLFALTSTVVAARIEDFARDDGGDLGHVGRTLIDIVLGTPCDEIDATTASLGVTRAFRRAESTVLCVPMPMTRTNSV
jgi:hypothetical protein